MPLFGAEDGTGFTVPVLIGSISALFITICARAESLLKVWNEIKSSSRKADIEEKDATIARLEGHLKSCDQKVDKMDVTLTAIKTEYQELLIEMAEYRGWMEMAAYVNHRNVAELRKLGVEGEEMPPRPPRRKKITPDPQAFMERTEETAARLAETAEDIKRKAEDLKRAEGS